MKKIEGKSVSVFGFPVVSAADDGEVGVAIKHPFLNGGVVILLEGGRGGAGRGKSYRNKLGNHPQRLTHREV